MQSYGRRWTIQDRDGNPIYLTEERWQHIVEANNHPEIADYEDHLKQTIQSGRRRQEPLTRASIVTCSYSTICQQDSIMLLALCSLDLMLMLRIRWCRTTLLPQLF